MHWLLKEYDAMKTFVKDGAPQNNSERGHYSSSRVLRGADTHGANTHLLSLETLFIQSVFLL